MNLLVIAEHDHQQLSVATRNTVSAALSIGRGVHLLVAGNHCDAVVQQAVALQGVIQVKVADAASYAAQTAENLAALIVANVASYTHVLAPATVFGKSFLPRVAALLGVDQISEVCAVESADTFVHHVYAGNMLATIRSDDPVKVLTVRPCAFEAVGDGGCATVEKIATAEDAGLSKVLQYHLTRSERPDLGSARVVVAGGRGLGSGENFNTVLMPLADKLSAALGASYGAVDAGYVTNDFQVGQTGKIVAPMLYIAIGISGAIQHLAGMKDSRVIVAINKDPEAPIFKVADYGLVADLFEAVPALVQALE